MNYTALGVSLSVVLAASVAVGIAKEKVAEKAKDEKVPAALDFKVKTIEGKEIALKEYHGKVVMVVNVASQCGLTPQYKQLEALHEKYEDKGLVILGFPCNQFGSQEPGTEKEIQEFCKSNYDVKFPMFSKIDVNGEKAHDLYKFLTAEETNPKFAGKIKWNFAKFLISRDGEVVNRFEPATKPDADEVIEAIEKELEKKGPEKKS